jgi:hypothetical protein
MYLAYFCNLHTNPYTHSHINLNRFLMVGKILDCPRINCIFDKLKYYSKNVRSLIVRCQSFAGKEGIQSQVPLCRLCDGQGGTGTGFSLTTSVLSCHFSSH